jgi:hypothetical protein
MNRKLYGIFLAAGFLASSFLTSCSSSSNSHIIPPPPATTPFAFYLTGQEAPNTANGNQISYYSLAGAVTIDANGNVTAGEQDYNDAFGITSPQPGGDSITGGTLTVDATGQGTLTLITSNALVGAAGTETLAVQFVNADHALISQFDGSATSSGSMDLQTSLTSAPSGAFAFTVSGVDPNYFPFAIGGVFTLPGAATDVVDLNDAGVVTPGTALTVSLGTPDAFGRGVVTTSLTGISLNYYVVGPEAIRIIDVDTTDAAVGSAFGQGSNATGGSNASIVPAIFGVSGNPWSGIYYSTAGQITPDATTGTFTGVGESAEMETHLSGAASVLAGTYSIAGNGYGSLGISGFGGGDVSAFQVYATDPTLDLMDPNNANGNPDVGGVLLLDFDTALSGGTGVAIAQTDTTSTDFNGTYAAGWQNFNALLGNNVCFGCEFDLVEQGTMASGGALGPLNAEISDPFQTLAAGVTTTPGTFTGTPTPDPNPANAGRFSMLTTDAGGPLGASIPNSSVTFFDAVVYQASASELFWIEFDFDSVFLGSLEQQGSLTGVPAVVRPANTRVKQK